MRVRLGELGCGSIQLKYRVRVPELDYETEIEAPGFARAASEAVHALESNAGVYRVGMGEADRKVVVRDPEGFGIEFMVSGAMAPEYWAHSAEELGLEEQESE